MNQSFIYVKPILSEDPPGWEDWTDEKRKEYCQDVVHSYEDFVFDVFLRIRPESNQASLEKTAGIKTWECDECGIEVRGTQMPKLGETALCPAHMIARVVS